MPSKLLSATLIDLRANVEEMGRLATALDGEVRAFTARPGQETMATMRGHLGRLRQLNHENVNLLFAADAGLGAMTMRCPDGAV